MSANEKQIGAENDLRRREETEKQNGELVFEWSKPVPIKPLNNFFNRWTCYKSLFLLNRNIRKF